MALDVLDRRGFGETNRRDAWWATPAATAIILLGFVVYATWSAFQGDHYHFGNYISPFYSPELFGDSPHAWFGSQPEWWPGWLPFSPALLILWAPAGFRLTCYYYRGAYYKAIWQDPPACAVGEPRDVYHGEHSFPLILQSLHRFFVIIAIPFLVILTWDVWQALWFVDPASGVEEFGIGVGTLVLAVNTFFLGSYATGCHSIRHAVGGRLDSLRGRRASRTLYRCVSCFNRRHMLWAWCSLISVAFADAYVRLCSMGIWHDWRIL